MRTLCFELSMPGAATWNGNGRYYAVLRTFGNDGKADQILAVHRYSYGWSDGWRASVAVREVSASEAREVKKRSVGFCGYEWMVNSILEYGQIYADHERPDRAKAEA